MQSATVVLCGAALKCGSSKDSKTKSDNNSGWNSLVIGTCGAASLVAVRLCWNVADTSVQYDGATQQFNTESLIDSCLILGPMIATSILLFILINWCYPSKNWSSLDVYGFEVYFANQLLVSIYWFRERFQATEIYYFIHLRLPIVIMLAAIAGACIGSQSLERRNRAVFVYFHLSTIVSLLSGHSHNRLVLMATLFFICGGLMVKQCTVEYANQNKYGSMSKLIKLGWTLHCATFGRYLFFCSQQRMNFGFLHVKLTDMLSNVHTLNCVSLFVLDLRCFYWR